VVGGGPARAEGGYATKGCFEIAPPTWRSVHKAFQTRGGGQTRILGDQPIVRILECRDNQFNHSLHQLGLFARGIRCQDCRSSLSGVSSQQPTSYTVFSCHVDFEHMDADIPRQKRRNASLSSLNLAIDTTNLAKELSHITPAKSLFGSVSVVLTLIRVGFLLAYVSRLLANVHRTR
jgi:hypothetical protein